MNRLTKETNRRSNRPGENMKWESGSVSEAAGKQITEYIKMQEKIAHRSFHNSISTAAIISCQIMA